MDDIVTERLSESFGDLMDYGFTAEMEEKRCVQTVKKFSDVLNDFYEDFSGKLSAAQAEVDDGGVHRNNLLLPAIICQHPDCTSTRVMQIRTGTTGVFLGCSGYTLPPESVASIRSI